MRQILGAAVICCTVAAGVQAASETGSKPDATSSLTAFVQDRLVEHQVAAASIALIENRALSEVLAAGQVSADHPAPVSTDSVFQVGSVSKPVAAWVAMTLVQAGKLDLDTPVSEYLTRWQLPDSDHDADGVTLRRLLSHTAGLSLHGYPGFPMDADLPRVEQSLSGATNGSGAVFLDAEPGSSFSYSGGGYTLMQLLVEEVTGQTFSDYASAAVLAPLGMTSSSYTPDPALETRVATPHDFSLGVVPNHRFRAQAAASLHATAADLGRFVVANLTPNPVLTPESLRLMHSGIEDTGGDQIGLGFFVYDGKFVGHSGSNFGWKALIRFVPDDGTGIVILTNSESGDWLSSDVLCYWDQHFSGAYLQDRCARRTAAIADSRQESRLTGVIIAAVALAIAGFCFAGIQFGRLRLLRWPVSSWRTLLAGLLLAGALGWGLFLFTPLGVLLVSGASAGIATIHYAPLDFAYPGVAVIVLLMVLAAACMVGKTSTRVG